MSAFRQIAAVVAFDLRSLPQRARTSFVIVIGIAGVVAVLISVLSLSTGLVHALTATGRPDRAIVLHKEATNEVSSSLPRQTVFTLLEEPGIARDAAGKPIASAETLASINIPRRDSGAVGALTLRGVSPQAFELRPEIRLTPVDSSSRGCESSSQGALRRSAIAVSRWAAASASTRTSGRWSAPSRAAACTTRSCSQMPIRCSPRITVRSSTPSP